MRLFYLPLGVAVRATFTMQHLLLFHPRDAVVLNAAMKYHVIAFTLSLPARRRLPVSQLTRHDRLSADLPM